MNITRLISSLFLIVMVLGLQACGGGGSAGTPSPVGDINQAPPIAIRMNELSSYLVNLSGEAEPNLYQYDEGLYAHRFGSSGRSFCVPTNPDAAPNIINASGSTTIYNCQNNVTLSYSILNITTLRVIIEAPKAFSQVSGTVDYLGSQYSYAGYMTADNLKVAFDIQIIDNNDGTYSLGTLSYANIYTVLTSQTNKTFSNVTFTTNNATVNSFIASGNLLSSAYPMISPTKEIVALLNTEIGKLGSFLGDGVILPNKLLPPGIIPTGYYAGSLSTVTPPQSDISARAIVDSDRFILVHIDNAGSNTLMYVGTFTNVTTSTFTADVRIYLNGEVIGTATISNGNFIEGSSFSGTLSGAGAYTATSFSMVFDKIINSRTTLSHTVGDVWLSPGTTATKIIFSSASQLSVAYDSTSFVPYLLDGCGDSGLTLTNIGSGNVGRIQKYISDVYTGCTYFPLNISTTGYIAPYDDGANDNRYLWISYNDAVSFAADGLILQP